MEDVSFDPQVNCAVLSFPFLIYIFLFLNWSEIEYNGSEIEYNIILASSVQYNDSVFVYMYCQWSLQMFG